MKYFEIHVNGDARKDSDGYSIFVKGNMENDAEAMLYAADNQLYRDPGDVQYVDYVDELKKEEYLEILGLEKDDDTTLFTKEELQILSNAMLNLIRSTNVALTMTYDPVSINALKLANIQYQNLNKKICKMIGDNNDV